MTAMKKVLFLATSMLLLVCSVYGSIDAAQRQLVVKGGGADATHKLATRRKLKNSSKGDSEELEEPYASSDEEEKPEHPIEESGKGGSGKSGSKDASGKGKGGSDDDDDEDSSSSSSKGKGGKGGDEDSGKGKGGKGDDEDSGKGKGGSSKGSSKKGGSSKMSKKGKGKGDGGNTKMPSMPTPITAAPTSADSISIRAAPYALFYTIEDERVPSTQEYAELAEVTRVYLEEFMTDEFSETSLTNLDDFLTFMIRNSFEFGSPVQADYRSSGLFNPSSIFLPTVREMNQLIDSSFMGDNLAEYLRRVRALSSKNVFSSCTTITKGDASDILPIPRVSDSANASEGSGFIKGGVASAAAGIVVLAAGLVLLKKRRQADSEVEFDNHNRNLKGDATVAGETCNMSLDGSTWRKESPYADNDDLDDEFEDEPLDSDEDEDADAPRHPPSQAFKHAIAITS